MIHVFSVKNFLSVKDAVTLSFEPKKSDNHLKEVHLVEPVEGVQLLKLGILYGGNASGKSNIIKALGFIREFWFNVNSTSEEDIPVVPFKFDADCVQSPSEFSLVFYQNGLKYRYSLLVDKHIVHAEKLDYYPGIQPASVFSRTYEDGVSKIFFGPKIKISEAAKEELRVKCLSNISFFAAYRQVNARAEQIDKAAEWMNNRFMPPVTPLSSLRQFTEKLLFEHDECSNSTLRFLKEADFNLSDILKKEEETNVTEDMIKKLKNIGFPDSHLNELEKKKSLTLRRIEFEHSVKTAGKDTHFNMSLDEQSDGTVRMFGLSGVLFQALEKNAFLAVDEIESKLHPLLIEYVLQRFLEQSEQSQLFVTTHYDNLFDEDDLLRKDNFWFIEKEKDGSSEMYPLQQFTGLHRISSLQKAYKYGKFGAIPEVE